MVFELFNKHISIYWEDAETGVFSWQCLPSLLKSNIDVCCSKDICYLINCTQKDLNPEAAHALVECFRLVKTYCPSYSSRINIALDEMSRFNKRDSVRTKAIKYQASVA